MQNSARPQILIVRLSSLGDIIHTYPMLYDIKSNFPLATVDWLVDQSFVSLVELNPLVNNVITIPLRCWKKEKLKLLANFRQWRKLNTQKNYDYIIDSQGLVKSALIAKSFNGMIYGLGKNSIREKIASLFYYKKFETGKQLLAITKNRILASMIFGYKINKDIAEFGLNQINYPAPQLNIAKKYVIFFHATSKDSKKYPAKQWAELAQYLIKHHNLCVILPYGSEKEKGEALEIQAQINSTDAIVPPQVLNYTQLSGLISNAVFIFGVDTGLIHLANALNKKLIAIYVDTNPKKTGIFASNIAKNIGNINQPPSVATIINLYQNIMKI